MCTYVVLDTESSVDTVLGVRRLVSLAYRCTGDNKNILQYIDHQACVKHALALDEVSFAVHGISVANPPHPRVTIWSALYGFFRYINQFSGCVRVVAHGATCDVSLILSESIYCGIDPACIPDCIFNVHCTKISSVSRCAIPFYAGGYKWPALHEALYLICGKTSNRTEFHNAADDVDACVQVLDATVDLKSDCTTFDQI